MADDELEALRLDYELNPPERRRALPPREDVARELDHLLDYELDPAADPVRMALPLARRVVQAGLLAQVNEPPTTHAAHTRNAFLVQSGFETLEDAGYRRARIRDTFVEEVGQLLDRRIMEGDEETDARIQEAADRAEFLVMASDPHLDIPDELEALLSVAAPLGGPATVGDRELASRAVGAGLMAHLNMPDPRTYERNAWLVQSGFRSLADGRPESYGQTLRDHYTNYASAARRSAVQARVAHGRDAVSARAESDAQTVLEQISPGLWP